MISRALYSVLAWLGLLTADIYAAWRFHWLAVEKVDSEMAGWSTLAMAGIFFGTLCLLFPLILGGMEGPAGRGAWLNPTPAGVVRVIGWGLVAAPALLFLVIKASGHS
jgi:hypothetical protein